MYCLQIRKEPIFIMALPIPVFVTVKAGFVTRPKCQTFSLRKFYM